MFSGRYTLLAKKLCDSSFYAFLVYLIHSHFNMYGFRSYLFLYIIMWFVGYCCVCFGVNHWRKTWVFCPISAVPTNLYWIVHLLRHNHNCSLDTNTTVTKLGWHIDVIMVHPVILHIAVIVVGYWWNGCSYRNIAREVGLHSNTDYGVIKRFHERGNFVCGRYTRRCLKTIDREDRVLYRFYRENRRSSVQRLRRAWQPNVNFAVFRQTVNRRLVARAYRARQMVSVPRLTARATILRRHWAQKHINRSLGQWQHVIFCDESRFMLFRIDKSDPCSKTGCRSHEWRLYTW